MSKSFQKNLELVKLHDREKSFLSKLFKNDTEIKKEAKKGFQIQSRGGIFFRADTTDGNLNLGENP
jgi:hypothetical protein